MACKACYVPGRAVGVSPLSSDIAASTPASSSFSRHPSRFCLAPNSTSLEPPLKMRTRAGCPAAAWHRVVARVGVRVRVGVRPAQAAAAAGKGRVAAAADIVRGVPMTRTRTSLQRRRRYSKTCADPIPYRLTPHRILLDCGSSAFEQHNRQQCF